MEADVAGIAKVLGGREVLGTELRSLGDLERAVVEGLPKETVRRLARAVYGDAHHQRALIHAIIPEATYKRRQSRLSQAESERAERLARIVDRGSGRSEAEVVWENGPGHRQDDIRARLGRILGRDVEQDQAEPQSGASEPGHESRSIRDRLQKVLRHDKPIAHEKPDREHGHESNEAVQRHRDRGDEHEL